MPKDEKHLKSLRLLKKERKNKKILFQPYKIYWQVMGAGGPGAPTSLLLYTDSQVYLFNCGEGAQRMTAFVNMQKSMAQLDNLFVTSKSWKNMGGLPGLCLTVRASAASEITIHGPPGCMHLYDATYGFLNLLEFTVNEYRDKVFSDNAVNIHEVQIISPTTTYPSEIPASWDAGTQPGTQLKIPYVSSVQAYICTFIPRAGKLDVEKLVDAGIPPGPMYGMLKAGKNVTLEDGRVIKSQDVLAHASSSSSSIIIEIPDSGYFDSLESSVKFTEAKNLETIFHFSPPEVIRDERYVAWMKRFPSNVDHVILNEDSTGMGMTGITAHQAKLRQMSTTLFPELKGTLTDPGPRFTLDQLQVSNQHGLNIIQAKAGLKLHVRPSNQEKIELDPVLLYNEAAVVEGVLKGTDIQFKSDQEEYAEELGKELEQTQQQQQLQQRQQNCEDLYPEVTFLGTGSAVPSKYRNVSCILVEVKPESFIILDCGEGSLSQLYRLHGQEGAERILRQVTAIYLSHQHADHQLGTINIILARENAFRKVGSPVQKLYIVTTAKYGHFLVSYHNKIQSVLSNTELIKCEELIFYPKKDKYNLDVPGDKHHLIDPAVLQQFLVHTGLSMIETCKAVHCAHAFCLAVRTEAGYKLTYSGDTRPSDNLVNLGRDSDLLIHEGTMEHCMLEDAIIKKHSTFTEAIKEGRDMGAKFTILTHFSQRYSKLPLLDEIEDHEDVGIAFDNMVVNPQTLSTIRTLYPPLKRIFWSEINDMVEKTQLILFKEKKKEDKGFGETKKEKVERLNQRYEEKQKKFEYIQMTQEKAKMRAERLAEIHKEERAKQEKAKQEKDKDQGVSKKAKLDR